MENVPKSYYYNLLTHRAKILANSFNDQKHTSCNIARRKSRLGAQKYWLTMFTDNRCAKISANNIHGENNKYPLPQKYWLPFSMTKKLPVVIVQEGCQD